MSDSAAIGFGATNWETHGSASAGEDQLVAAPQFDRDGPAKFEWLAVNDPRELARRAAEGFQGDAVLVAQAAEAMALSCHPPLMIRALRILLKHDRPFVREAALNGLVPFLSSSMDARDDVHDLAERDASPGVRATAAEILKLI